jgi:hypothetical protein
MISQQPGLTVARRGHKDLASDGEIALRESEANPVASPGNEYSRPL